MARDTILRVRFEGKVDPSLEKSADRMTMIASGIGTAVGSLAARGIGKGLDLVQDFFDGSIEQASNLRESINITTLMFGAEASRLEGFFASSARAVGMSEAATREYTSQMGGLLQNLDFSTRASADWSTTLVQLAADMGSAFNADTDQAIRAIGAGLRGESEPLKQFNVFLSDAEVKTKAVELGLYSGTGALDKHAAAQARLAIIMEDTSRIAGDFGQNLDQEANKSKQVQAEYENLQATVGERLLPLKVQLLALTSDKIIPAFTAFAGWLEVTATWLGQNADVLVPLGAGLGVAVAALWAFNAAQAVAAGGGLVQFLLSAARGTTLFTAAQWLMNAALWANPIGIVILALVALGAGLAIAWNKSETFRSIVTGAWEGIKGVVSGVVGWVTETALPALAGFWEGAQRGFGGLVEFVGTWASRIKAAVMAPINWIGQYVLNPLLAGIEKVADVFGLKWKLPRFGASSPSSSGGRATSGAMRAFAFGGYTGPGGKFEPAGIVHAGEIVWSQEDVAAHGGPWAVEALRTSRRLPQFASGGIVPNAKGWTGMNPAFLHAAQAWARATGILWRVTGNGGYRAFADQLRAWNLYRSGRGPLAANPYKGGPHMRGEALDLSPRPGDNPRARGLLGRFGLGLTVQGEPWHVGWLRRTSSGAATATSRGGVDPLTLIKSMIRVPDMGALGGGMFGALLREIPTRMISGAAKWIGHQLGFDGGGWLPVGATLAVNRTGHPEAVLTPHQWDVLASAARFRGDGTMRLHPDDMEHLVRLLSAVLVQMPAPVVSVEEITDKQRRYVRALG